MGRLEKGLLDLVYALIVVGLVVAIVADFSIEEARLPGAPQHTLIASNLLSNFIKLR